MEKNGKKYTPPVRTLENHQDTQKLDKEKLVEFRMNQSKSSRLAEYITGLRPSDPRMADRIIEDQKIIRAKYHLPPREVMFDSPTEYEHALKEMAQKNNVTIKDKSECGRFFDTYFASGFYTDTTHSAVVGINRNDGNSYARGLGVLEHELIHAEQHVHQKNMPVELMEYEAYVAGLNTRIVKERPEDIEFMVFGFLILGSVKVWYKQLNEGIEPGAVSMINPVWDDPVFFLKNVDGVDQNDIDLYLQKNKK